MKKNRKNEKRDKLEIFLYNKIYFIYDIYCPFIDIPLYNDYVFLNIPLRYIEKYNLKNDYISFFEKNKKSNNLLYITFDNNSQIKILKDINIDFSKVKILYFKFDTDIFGKISINTNLCFSEILLLINMKNNLEILCLDFSYEISTIDINVFDSLNNLKSLKHIEFIYLKISAAFKIILPNLETINLNSCQNIYFDNEKSTKNIKYLELNHTDIKFGLKYKFNNLEELNIIESIIDIDFTSLQNLKSLKSNKINIIENIINYSSIVKLSNYNISNFTLEEEKKFLEIILMNKTLKEIEIELNEFSKEILTKINFFNNQRKTITLNIKKK